MSPDAGTGPRRLRGLRWAVRATLLFGVAASVAANVLHARPHPVSQIIAAWPPVALLLTVELISRVPAHRRTLAAIRLAATTCIAGIAAWISYWHMVGVTARHGETGASPYLLPLSVDGLVVVASISLVEISARLRTQPAVDDTTPTPSEPATAKPEPTPVPDPTPPAENRTGDAPAATRTSAPRRPATRSTAAAAKRTRDTYRSAGNAATRDAVQQWRSRDPALRPADIARRIGRSERTVRRNWTTTPPPEPAPGPEHRTDRQAPHNNPARPAPQPT